MRKLGFVKNAILLGIFLIVVYSCTKDFEFDKISTDDLSGEWAFPLINSTISLEDIINDTTGIISTGEDGLISLIYESDSIVSIDGKERTAIPDQEKVLSTTFELPDSLYLAVESLDTTLIFDYELEMLEENHRIDSLYLNHGVYTIGINTNLNFDEAEVSLVVPNFIRFATGEPFQVTFNLNNPNQQEISLSETIDLTNYFVHFDNGVQENKININAFIHIELDDNPNQLPYYFNIINQFNEIAFERFYGYIGEIEESYFDTIDISIFNSTDFSNLEFGEGGINLNLDVYNSLGIPMKLDISRFMAYNTLNPDDSIQLNFDPNIFEINYPPVEAIGEFALTEIGVNNFNINEILSISPNRLILDILGLINDGSTSETINHFTSDSRLYVDASFEMELFGGISAFEIVDTLDYDPLNFENFDALEFMVEITNGFPINANFQIEFVDENFDVLYTLIPLSEDLVEAGIVGPGPEYRVTSPSNKTTFILVERNGLDLIKQTNKIFFKALLSTEDGQVVKFYDDYFIQLQLGAKVVYVY